jgi:solute carrier family 31 (copper transporter), member 1
MTVFIRRYDDEFSRPRLLSMYHIVQTLLHILQMGISYLLMLIAMTFNTYLFLAVILGAGFGHFLFGWRRTTVIDYNEHCH